MYISGLNLLSALSSHEYATLDLLNRESVGASGMSTFSGRYGDNPLEINMAGEAEESEANYKVLLKKQLGRENEVSILIDVDIYFDVPSVCGV